METLGFLLLWILLANLAVVASIFFYLLVTAYDQTKKEREAAETSDKIRRGCQNPDEFSYSYIPWNETPAAVRQFSAAWISRDTTRI